MANFQKTVLIIVIIALIITLAMIGYSLGTKKAEVWPPIVPQCPDYWLIDGSGNNTRCINSKKLGVCPPKSGDKFLTMNFNKAPFNGSDSACAKYKWANKCKVSWDGINYGVNNPCS
jgi:hypothetical protein